MKLQLALDGSLDSSLELLEGVHPYIHIAEVGTPLIFREGIAAIREVCRRYPDLPVLADLKIADAGYAEARLAFDAGASLVTVLGFAPDVTVSGVVSAARECSGQVVADMLQIIDPSSRGAELIAQGCDVLCLHLAHDLQGQGTSPIDTYEEVRYHLPSASLSLAGGVSLDNLDRLLPIRPDILVVGKAITLAPDPVSVARSFYDRINP
jgi:3-hexulose-6-phosphate synthase